MKDLFGHEVVEPPPRDEFTRWGNKKRKPTKRNGYGGIPGTGPAGETCGSCRHHVIHSYARDYHKCALAKAIWTGGPGSDILVRSPACSRWEPEAT